MALVWHDWFATSNQGVRNQRFMLDQNELFRRLVLGSFRDLLLGVTRDPAMLVWLNGNTNTKASPNENYGREMMELFTLGADRGYGEQDVREQARALTGWTSKRAKGVGYYDFRYEPRLHDDGRKTIFGKSGAFGWEEACRLCLEHPLHPAYFVRKLWDYFVPVAPSRRTRQGLEKLYRKNLVVRPVVEAILRHPALYAGPRMVKPPTVYTAGLLRAIGRGIDSDRWFRLGILGGQRLFYPPNVAGWDESRWLDTVTFRGRWLLAAWALRPYALSPDAAAPASPSKLVDRAVRFLGSPRITPTTRLVLVGFAKATLAQPGASPAMVENALRQLISVSPDLQTA
jgi:uncharacterized protein (DUF1800 family)